MSPAELGGSGPGEGRGEGEERTAKHAAGRGLAGRWRCAPHRVDSSDRPNAPEIIYEPSQARDRNTCKSLHTL